MDRLAGDAAAAGQGGGGVLLAVLGRTIDAVVLGVEDDNVDIDLAAVRVAEDEVPGRVSSRGTSR